MASAPWKNRIVGSGEEAPDQLLANPANWRVHPKNQQDALRGALDTVGWVQQVMVNRRTGYVVDGHARVALALTRGEPTVPVLYVELEPDEEKVVLASLDPIGAMAVADHEKLLELLEEVKVDDEALGALIGSLANPDGYSYEDRMKEWGGMPEFAQEDQLGYKALLVHFASAEDMDAFSRLVGQNVGPKTRSIWYPEAEISHAQALRYTTDA